MPQNHVITQTEALPTRNSHATQHTLSAPAVLVDGFVSQTVSVLTLTIRTALAEALVQILAEQITVAQTSVQVRSSVA